jgi:hypothetical protein
MSLVVVVQSDPTVTRIFDVHFELLRMARPDEHRQTAIFRKGAVHTDFHLREKTKQFFNCHNELAWIT